MKIKTPLQYIAYRYPKIRNNWYIAASLDFRKQPFHEKRIPIKEPLFPDYIIDDPLAFIKNSSNISIINFNMTTNDNDLVPGLLISPTHNYNYLHPKRMMFITVFGKIIHNDTDIEFEMFKFTDFPSYDLGSTWVSGYVQIPKEYYISLGGWNKEDLMKLKKSFIRKIYYKYLMKKAGFKKCQCNIM